MALAPELRTLLEAIEQRAAVRDAETRQRVDALATNVGTLATEIKATRAVAEAALAMAVQARERIEAARTEARALRHSPERVRDRRK